MSELRYRVSRPSAALEDVVDCYWALEGDDSTPGGRDRILPDGTFELVFNFADPFLHYVDGCPVRQPPDLAVGELRRAMVVASTGRVAIFGIRLRPGGFSRLSSLPPSELLDRTTTIGSLPGQWHRYLHEKLADAHGFDARVAIAERHLGQTWAPAAAASPIPLVVSRLLAARGLVSVSRLARDAGISPRTLERRFRNEVGIGPKTLCRLRRLRIVSQALAEGQVSWAALAARAGYADQAHLSREFKVVAGVTPAAWLRERHPMADRFGHDPLETASD